jgi:hypothetical protein
MTLAPFLLIAGFAPALVAACPCETSFLGLRLRLKKLVSNPCKRTFKLIVVYQMADHLSMGKI